MTLTKTICPDRIVLRAVKKAVRSAEVGALAPVFEKSVPELKHKHFLNVKEKYILRHLTLEPLIG